jgi:hypothetical protein
MPREVGKTWERFGRRFHIRLSLKRPAEVELMDEYDRRSEILGKEDKEFLKDCLVAGFRVLTNKGNSNNHVDLSSNEINNTGKQHAAHQPVSGNGGEVKTTAGSPVADEVPASTGVPAKLVLGGLMKHG